MSESLRYIHTQQQAQAELDRRAASAKASANRRKQLLLNNPQLAQEEREKQSQRKRNNRNKKRNLPDSENSWQVDLEMDAARKAKSRRIVKDKQFVENAQEREALIEKVRQRYVLYDFSLLMVFSIAELDAQFADLQVKEQLWPIPAPDVTPMYKKILTHTYKLGQNIVCACCGCISHDIAEFEVVLDSCEPLRHFCIPENVNIPFDFSCGIDRLDQNHILIDKLRITQDKRILLCRVCHDQLSKDRQPSEALANFRWVGPVPHSYYNSILTILISLNFYPSKFPSLVRNLI